MTKRIIFHENYQEPFEDRRMKNMHELTGDIKSWWPIWVSIAGLLIIIGVWLTTVKTTAVLAGNTAYEVRTLDTRVTKVETVVNTELPIVKGDVSVIKTDVKKLLQVMSAVKVKLDIYDGKD